MGSLIERPSRRWMEKRRDVGARVRPYPAALCTALLLAAACAGLWQFSAWASPTATMDSSESDAGPGDGWSEWEREQEWGPSNEEAVAFLQGTRIQEPVLMEAFGVQVTAEAFRVRESLIMVDLEFKNQGDKPLSVIFSGLSVNDCDFSEDSAFFVELEGRGSEKESIKLEWPDIEKYHLSSIQYMDFNISVVDKESGTYLQWHWPVHLDTSRKGSGSPYGNLGRLIYDKNGIQVYLKLEGEDSGTPYAGVFYAVDHSGIEGLFINAHCKEINGRLCDWDMDWRYLEPGKVVSWKWSMDSGESQELSGEMGEKLRSMKLSLDIYIDNRGYEGGDIARIDVSDDILLEF